MTAILTEPTPPGPMPAQRTAEAPAAGLDPRIDHPWWCSIEHHEFAGDLDQRHREEPRVVEIPAGGIEAWQVSVCVEQYLGRAGGAAGVWEPIAGSVSLEVAGSGDTEAGLDLTPREARRIAAELLAAADLAEGVTR